MTDHHPNLDVLARYADGGPGLDEASLWSVEVHLETCPDCRARLAGSTPEPTRMLLDRVAAGLDSALAGEPAPAPMPRPLSAVRRRWFVRTLTPWLIMTVAVLAVAVLLQSLQPGLPSLVLLLAPVAPLPGVAVAWSRRTDPAWELIAGTPGAGLAMLLRRTAAVLAVVVPALALAGIGSGTGLALLLLPSLACTAAVIALGGVIGVHRAALAIGVLWAAVVALPALATAELPVTLQPGSVPVWALATVALAAFAATRTDAYRRLSSR